MRTLLLPTTTPDLLTAADERELACRIEAGVLARAVLDGLAGRPAGATDEELHALADEGRAAFDRFVAANLRLVASLALRAARASGVDADELYQEGCVGLAEAVRRFDAARGLRFSTFAHPWVHNAIRACQLRRGGRSEASTWRARQAAEVRRFRAEMEAGLGRHVDVDELARALGRDRAQVAALEVADEPPVVGVDLAALPVACERAERALTACETFRPEWFDRVSTMPSRVLAWRYGLDDGEDRPVEWVARRLGVSTSTVRRLERQGLAEARALLGAGDGRERPQLLAA